MTNHPGKSHFFVNEKSQKQVLFVHDKTPQASSILVYDKLPMSLFCV
jgi:hypothetical protein